MEVVARRLTRRIISPRLPFQPHRRILSLLRFYHRHREQKQECPHQPSSHGPSDFSLSKTIRDLVISGVGGLDEMESALERLLPTAVSPALVAHVLGSGQNPAFSAGDTRRLLRFFSWSWRRRAAGDGTHEDKCWGKAFNHAIRTFAERNDATAVGILVCDLQRERRAGLDLDTFACVVESLVKSGREDDAVRLFRMLERDEEQPHGGRGGGGRTCERSCRVVAIVHALCARGHARKAEGVVWHHRDKLDPPEKQVVYLSLLHGWCIGRNAGEARKVLEEMKPAGIRPGLASYTAFLRCLCERNLKFNPSALIPEAFSVMAEMRTAGLSPTAVCFNILLSCLVRARRVKEAYRVLHSMRTREAGRPAPDWTSYYLVVRVLYLTGRFVRGNRAIRQMLEAGLVPKACFFRSLIGLLCGLENVVFAIEVFDHMKRCCEEDCGPVYDLLVTKLCKSGKFDMGRRLWDEAVERGIALTCSGDLLDPSKTEVFKPIKNIGRLDAKDTKSSLNKKKNKKKKKKRKGAMIMGTTKRRKKKSCST